MALVDGRLQSSDFVILQRVMNFYAKSLLYDTKLAAQEARGGLIESDFGTWVKTVQEQLKKEFDSYQDAVAIVCETTKISQKVFNDTYGSEPTNRSAIANELSNTFLSPFISSQDISKDRAIEIFTKSVRLALEKLKAQEIADEVVSHDDVLIFFDNLLVDYVKLHFEVNCEEFKATVSKYDLLNDAAVKTTVDVMIDTIIKLSPNFEAS